jgi:hypothetical protein
MYFYRHKEVVNGKLMQSVLTASYAIDAEECKRLGYVEIPFNVHVHKSRPPDDPELMDHNLFMGSD